MREGSPNQKKKPKKHWVQASPVWVPHFEFWFWGSWLHHFNPYCKTIECSFDKEVNWNKYNLPDTICNYHRNCNLKATCYSKLEGSSMKVWVGLYLWAWSAKEWGSSARVKAVMISLKMEINSWWMSMVSEIMLCFSVHWAFNGNHCLIS